MTIEGTAGGPERDALRGVIGGVLSNAKNFPDNVAVRILGQDMGPLIDRTADAILSAGYSKANTEFTNAGRVTVLALADYLAAHHPTRESDIAKAALATIRALEATKPRTVTTVEELDALPLGTLIEQRDGFRSLKKSTGRWHLCVDRAGSSGPEEIELPAVVLFVPVVKS